MFRDTPEAYKSLNSSDEEQLEHILPDVYTKAIGYQVYTKTEENAILSFMYLLMETTGLTRDICHNVLSFLPSPHSNFIFFNPFNHDGFYSMLDFTLLLFGNTVHYIICIALLFHTYSVTWLTFTVISFMESLIIACAYCYFYGFLKANNKWISNINDKFIVFYGSLHVSLIFIIDIPMIMILLYFYEELFLAELLIYAISYLICMLYKYMIYHQRIDNREYIYLGSIQGRYKTNLNVFPFSLITALIIFLYGVLTTNIICMIITAIVYYGGILIVNYMHWKNHKLNEENTLFKNKLCAITYMFLCVHNILFMTYSVIIYSDEDELNSLNSITGLICIIVGIFEACLIFIYYVFYNIIYCVFHDSDRMIGEYAYTLYGGKYKKYSDFFNYLYLTLEFIVNVPMMAMLLFYMFNNDVMHGAIPIAWYFVVLFYFFHDLYSFGLNFYYTPKRADMHLFYCRIIVFVVKLPLILFVFGAVYFVMTYLRKIGPSFHQMISVTFLVYSSLYFCCILPVCVIKNKSLAY